jgi:hypothetical protein
MEKMKEFVERQPPGEVANSFVEDSGNLQQRAYREPGLSHMPVKLMQIQMK